MQFSKWYGVYTFLYHKKMAIVNKLLCLCAVSIIKLYQQCFFAYRQYARCKYFPSCSDYMIMALQKYGFCIGAARGIWRVMRCHPLAKGGLDLP